MDKSIATLLASKVLDHIQTEDCLDGDASAPWCDIKTHKVSAASRQLVRGELFQIELDTNLGECQLKLHWAPDAYHLDQITMVGRDVLQVPRNLSSIRPETVPQNLEDLLMQLQPPENGEEEEEEAIVLD